MATSVKIDDTLKGRVQQLAASRDRSAHWIMCEAIREYVEREEAHESFKAEALASWTDFQETGQHITAHELAGWLTSWGSAEEGDCPQCHG
jgi:predicted transcriptional regulator